MEISLKNFTICNLGTRSIIVRYEPLINNFKGFVITAMYEIGFPCNKTITVSTDKRMVQGTLIIPRKR